MLQISVSSSLQVVYIDGSHHPQDVLTDAVLAWRLMKYGAIMIMDGMQCTLQHASAFSLSLLLMSCVAADYEWGQVVKKPPEETPKKAIDSFLECFSQV